MLHVDIPSRSDIERLFSVRAAACLSLYLGTTPLTQEAQADRIEMKNLARTGLEALHAQGVDRKDVTAIGDAMDDLIEDDDFWAHQARSLAVFATPERILTFRLPNALDPVVETGDRFFLKPLLRAVTVPQSAMVLALAQGSVRLVEVSGELPAQTVKVADLPKDAASAVGKASILGRTPSGRLQGAEGQKVRLRQYARQVDQALRETLAGREIPLILASTQPLDGIYRSVNTYAHLAVAGIPGNPELVSDADLAGAARQVLDGLHRDELKALHDEFALRATQGRATTDIAQAARAATFGAVSVLLVDIDEIIPGNVDEVTGAVVFGDQSGIARQGVVDQIAGRALLAGARVLGERRADIPGGGSLAAILRYPF
jgi:hypothetical protein